mmetsp:Transcript_44336/g.72160  ORF Transcript_44336/g.72160 Transcript_44336/m.72160 type:complete len:176 (+) Transcript_44336:57-584(+)
MHQFLLFTAFPNTPLSLRTRPCRFDYSPRKFRLACESTPTADDALSKAVENLNVKRITRHIFICAEPSLPKCVDSATSLESWLYLKNRMRELGLLDKAYRTKVNCLQLCSKGPIAVVYPDGAWYHSVTKDVVERILQEHIINGQVVKDNLIVLNNLTQNEGIAERVKRAFPGLFM